MPLDEAQLNRVRELLKECSAELRSGQGNTSKGTGFFIDDRLLLTCAHVLKAKEGEVVEVQPFGRAARPGTVLRRLEGKDVDLGLVRAESLSGEEPQPAVLLDLKATDNVDYFAVGFPREDLLNKSGLEEIAFSATRRLAGANKETEFLKIDQGKGMLQHGLSGGAVLNPRTGAIVALVQYSESSKGTEGGAAIPISRAARHLPEVTHLLEVPPASVRRWHEAIGERSWRELGKPDAGTSRLDIFLGGDRSKWTVRVDGHDEEYGLTGQDLSQEISMALFHWAQRRRIRSADDVRLLGDLLAGAIFPAGVGSALERACDAEKVLIRLHVDPESDLFDIPWELATLAIDKRNSYLGVDDRLGVARIIEQPTTIAPPVEGAARVIGAVMQPPGLQAQMPVLNFGSNQVAWPGPDEIATKLERSIQRSGFDAEVMSNPTPGDLFSSLEDSPPHSTTNAVVHYIGWGEIQEREPRLALFDNEGSLIWRSLTEVCEWVSASGARLFVIELTLPPQGPEPEAIAPRTFQRALSGQVEAVLFTRFPVHPSPLSAFNNVLYRGLAAGRTIENAVQAARRDTFVNRFSGDVSEFGCYTLLTGQNSGTTIFPEPETPVATGPGVGFKQRTPPVEDRAPTAKEPQIQVGFDSGGTR